MIKGGAMATAEDVLVESTASAAAESYLPDILSALRRLDRLLERAVAAAKAAYGAESAADRFRGLHISTGEVERLLARRVRPCYGSNTIARALRQSKRIEIPG